MKIRILSAVCALCLPACGGAETDTSDAPATADTAAAEEQPDPDHRLAWVDASGTVLGTIGPVMSSILDPAIDPDGNAIAVRGRMTPDERDHLYVLQGSTAVRLTDNEGFERHMAYSPDGSRIAYSIQEPGGVSNLYVRPADESGEDRPLVVSEGMHKWYPSWTPDGSTVVFHTNDPETEARDLWYVDVETGETSVLVDDPGIQALARVSRDGRFVAYQSDQDGQMEIYVTTFPASDARWRVSPSGGTWAKWSEDRLYYWEGNQLMAVDVSSEADGGFDDVVPEPLFTGAEVGMGADNTMSSYNPEYDVTADGSRFVVTQRVDG
ncbi:MAG: hypothetical protein R3324_11255 [Halobacteriales archaeon]|nr:hypothetical protein [Halobacteriales archaeon]